MRGQPIGLIAVISRRPLTNRSQAEAILKLAGQRAAAELERLDGELALRESEQKLRQIAESAREVFWLGAPDWNRIDYVSPAYESVWGRSCQSLIDAPRSWLDAVHPEDRARIELEITRASTTTLSAPELFEYRVERPEGGVRWISARVYPVRDEDQQVIRIVGIAEDITGRKQAEAEREKLQAQLTQAQKMESVGRLAGGVAHDFNNLLGAILAHAALVLQGLPPESPWRENLEEIEACAHRSADLTRQLLAFARKQTVVPKVLDLNVTVEACAKCCDGSSGGHRSHLDARGRPLAREGRSQPGRPDSGQSLRQCPRRHRRNRPGSTSRPPT